MRSETTYYAFDDTEFYSEEECLAYEEKIKNSLLGVSFFDEKTNPVIIDSPENAERFGDTMYFLVTEEDAAQDYLNWIKDYTGMDVPEETKWCKGDVWFYDDDNYEWINATATINRLQNIVNMIAAKEGENNG